MLVYFFPDTSELCMEAWLSVAHETRRSFLFFLSLVLFCFVVTLRWLSITIYVSNNFLNGQKNNDNLLLSSLFFNPLHKSDYDFSVGSPTSCRLFSFIKSMRDQQHES